MRFSLPSLLTGLFLVFFAGDFAYSCLQYYHQPLDGDMAWNLVPAGEVQPILRDPLGLQAILHGETYPNPNRFFSHWIYRTYLLGVPALLQNWFAPITSVYLACAIAKGAVHLILIGLLSRMVLGPDRSKTDYLLLACLLTPFFQSSFFRDYIGIIDPATSYLFFYALPAIFLLWFALPFTDRLLHLSERRLTVRQLCYIIPLAGVSCLSGPLNPGVVLVALTCVAVAWSAGGFRLRDLAWPEWISLTAIAVFALYSLYLGQYNSLTIGSQIPLAELYAKLPAGLLRQFTTKLAFPLLFLALTINLFLLRRAPLFRYLLLFAVLYVLLLPLGGYREYRPGIVRYDTILPLTLLLIGGYAATTFALLRRNKWYPLLPLAVALLFTHTDEFEPEAYACERAALETIEASPLTTVPLQTDCSVALWETYADPAWSELTGRLLYRWGITEEPKRYHHVR